MKSCYVAQLALNSWWSSCLRLLSSGITDLSHHTNSYESSSRHHCASGVSHWIFCFNILSYLCTLAQPTSRGQSSVFVGWFYTCFLGGTAGLSISIGFTSVDSIYTNPKSVLPFRYFLLILPQATQHFCLHCTALRRSCKDDLKYLGGCVYVHSVPWYKRLEHH